MRNLVNKIFLKDTILEESLLSPSLYISFDNYSALRKDYIDVLKHIKIFDNISIVKSNERDLNEGYQQGLYIINTGDTNYFIRLILSDGFIYDILIYKINDMNLINNVFFNQKEVAIPPTFLEKLSILKPVLILSKENNKYKLLKANKQFFDTIKYEDWDFSNKYLDELNQIALNQEILNLNQISLYQSDNNLITLGFQVEEENGIYLLTSNSVV